MPRFLLSIWSGTEWEGVIENTSSPVKAVCEPAAFGHCCLVMLSHWAPSLLRPANAVPTRQPAVPLHHHSNALGGLSWNTDWTGLENKVDIY